MKLQHDFLGKKVLVTGASGFIGTHLCRSLATRFAQVYGISRTHRSSTSKIHWLQTDLEDISSVRTLIRNIKPNFVYHLASNVTGSRQLDFVLPTLHSNFVSTVNLLTACTEIGCDRIILAGSLEEPEIDRDGIVPSSPYAAAKWASSTYSWMFYELYQTPVVTAKIFMVYGPGQNFRFLIPSTISALISGEAPQLSSGNRPVDWIYVSDLVSGLMAMTTAPDLEGKTIDLGTGTTTTIREVVEQLVKLINPHIQPLFGAISDRPNEQIRVANTANSYMKLGWQPIVSLEEGLKLTWEYQRQLQMV